MLPLVMYGIFYLNLAITLACIFSVSLTLILFLVSILLIVQILSHYRIDFGSLKPPQLKINWEIFRIRFPGSSTFSGRSIKNSERDPEGMMAIPVPSRSRLSTFSSSPSSRYQDIRSPRKSSFSSSPFNNRGPSLRSGSSNLSGRSPRDRKPIL
jgi:hypothetical protein